MTFKKNGADPVFAMLPGLTGQSWSLWAVTAPRSARAYVPPKIEPTLAPEQPEDHVRYRRSRNPKQRLKRRRNMLHVSKRVRRKHRRAA